MLSLPGESDYVTIDNLVSAVEASRVAAYSNAPENFGMLFSML